MNVVRIYKTVQLLFARVFGVGRMYAEYTKYGAPRANSDLKPGIVIVCIDDKGHTLKTGNFIELEVPPKSKIRRSNKVE